MANAKRSCESGGKMIRNKYPNKSPRSSPTKSDVEIRPSGPGARNAASPNLGPSSSPRTSPGLLAGHYAGCKFSEPPLPSALPLPPQHWMQQQHSSSSISGSAAYFPQKAAIAMAMSNNDIAQQLKVLLKVQA